jgi:NAD(P)H-quinone oxidoreductase subunit N
MALITTGKSFIRALETAGTLALYVPLEGGAEGRYQRRLRANGYQTINITARGLGDLAAYLTGIHGVRPPHLGKKNIGQEAAVGQVYYIPPIATYELSTLPANAKGLVLWILEGQILARQELEYLINLPKIEPRIKVAIEMGGERYFKWQPLADTLKAA